MSAAVAVLFNTSLQLSANDYSNSKLCFVLVVIGQLSNSKDQSGLCIHQETSASQTVCTW